MCLVYLTGEFGLDVVLGAFAAGIVVGLVTKEESAEPVRSKLEAIGFGFVIPNLLRVQRHHVRPARAVR